MHLCWSCHRDCTLRLLKPAPHQLERRDVSGGRNLDTLEIDASERFSPEGVQGLARGAKNSVMLNKTCIL